jgi:hypothetical protein
MERKKSNREQSVHVASKPAFRAAIGVALLLVTAVSGMAQEKPSLGPQQLVRRAARNEVKADSVIQQYFMYRDNVDYKSHSVTKQVIETPQGGLSLTLAINGQPLTPDQRAKENQKLEKFANDLEARRKKEQSSREDSQREELMLTSLPDAFLYTYAGTQRGPNGEDLVHLTFKPNPSFEPPNHETRAYQGMQGDMLIDDKAMRIAKIDGTLFRDVDFGWGILGRLYKGGKFIIEQCDVGNGRWETVRETLDFHGKILMIKPLTIYSTETATDFRPVPSNLTVAQALELLHKSDETVAQNSTAAKNGDGNHR